MIKSPPEEPILIQPVESPVICKPYYEPDRYWEYDRQTGRAALGRAAGPPPTGTSLPTRTAVGVSFRWNWRRTDGT